MMDCAKTRPPSPAALCTSGKPIPNRLQSCSVVESRWDDAPGHREIMRAARENALWQGRQSLRFLDGEAFFDTEGFTPAP